MQNSYLLRNESENSAVKIIEGIPTNFKALSYQNNSHRYFKDFSHYNPSEVHSIGNSYNAANESTMKIMHMFSAPFKSGDGSDPFRRYEYCFNEFY